MGQLNGHLAPAQRQQLCTCSTSPLFAACLVKASPWDKTQNNLSSAETRAQSWDQSQGPLLLLEPSPLGATCKTCSEGPSSFLHTAATDIIRNYQTHAIQLIQSLCVNPYRLPKCHKPFILPQSGDSTAAIEYYIIAVITALCYGIRNSVKSQSRIWECLEDLSIPCQRQTYPLLHWLLMYLELKPPARTPVQSAERALEPRAPHPN